MFYNAREDHEEIYPHQSDSVIRSIVVPNDFLNALLSELEISSSEVVFDRVATDDVRLRELLSGLYSFRSVPETCASSFDAALTDLALHVLQKHPHSHSRRVQSAVARCRFPRTVDRIKRKIKQNFLEEDYGLDQLSADVGISKFHLVRLFRAHEDKTPIQYRNLLRLNEAKKFLVSTDFEVSRIAFDVGYRDLSAFNKAFRACFSVNPSEYRKNSNKFLVRSSEPKVKSPKLREAK